MIDKVVLEVQNFSLPYARNDVKRTITYRGLEFTNRSSYRKDGTCFTNKFWCKYANMFLAIDFEKKTLQISNSLHHYFNREKGSGNSDNFTLSNVKETMQELSELLGVDLDNALVKQVELGVNVPVSALDAYGGLLSYRGKDYVPMQWKGETYGACCKFDQYRIKAYDKRKQLRLQKRIAIDEDVFRFELAVTNTKWLQKRMESIPLKFGRDLYNLEVVQYLVHELVTKYADSVKRGSDLNLSCMTLLELRAVAVMRDKEICEMVKHRFPRTYKEKSRVYNRLLKEKQQTLDTTLLQRMIKEKAVELLHL